MEVIPLRRLSRKHYCWHTSLHVYWYNNVIRSWYGFIFEAQFQMNVFWGCFSTISNVILSNYCCREFDPIIAAHNMNGNMAFYALYVDSPRATCTPHQPIWGFLKTYFFRMLDDYNLPPEIDISTQRWHAVMRHIPICFTLMDNTSSQINMLYNVKWNGVFEYNVLTGNYIPRTNVLAGGYYGFVVVTLPLRLCPQTLHQTTKNCYWSTSTVMLHVDLYRWEDSLEERWTQHDIWISPPPPPPPPPPGQPNCIF